MERNAYKVLIVEDDTISQFAIKKMLANDFRPFTAKNSKEAFEILSAHSFHIILMDINLGQDSMNGTEIMQRIKEDAHYGSPHIFAVTSYAQPEDKQTFLQQGFDHYLAKPVKKEDLLEAISQYAL